MVKRFILANEALVTLLEISPQGADRHEFDELQGAISSRDAGEKYRAASISSDADLGWRGFLGDIGIPAAVISFSSTGGDVGRQIFIVGFDSARTDPQFIGWLIAYAERCWQSSKDKAFWPFRISNPETTPDSSEKFPVPSAPSDLAPKTMLPQFDHASVARFACQGSSISALLFRPVNDGGFSSECRRSIDHVLPLFLQSAAAHVAGKRQERRTAQLEAMFDRVSLATLLVDCTGRPIFCNEAARTMLNDRTWLLISSDGTITNRNPTVSKRFKNAIRAVTTLGDMESSETVLRLDSEEGNWRLAYIVPAVSRFGDESSRCAMVLVHAPQREEASPPMLEALGLLPSEQRFLKSFLRSSSLNEAAMESGLSDETARTYLKRVRAKLGVHRQMELASLISGLVLPLRHPVPGPRQ